MRSMSIFSCIMKMISKFTMFFIFQMFNFKCFLIFAFSYDSCGTFVNNFIFFFLKLITFIVCSFKNSQNFFIQSLSMCTSCLFSMLLNEDIAEIEKPDGICLLTFVADEFSGLFLHPSIFLLYIQDLHK